MIKLMKWRIPVELFKTHDAYYAFDSNRVYFIQINELMFKILSKLKYRDMSIKELAGSLKKYSLRRIDDALRILKKIQDQSYLVPNKFERFKSLDKNEFKKILNHNMKSLKINISAKCNLSCKYCIFGGEYSRYKSLNNEIMSWSIAKKAIEFYLKRSKKEGRLEVAFFGGEPFLAFPLIKKIINELKSRLVERKNGLDISISTNGTIINDEIANFIIKNNVIIQVSLDGGKKIHDRNRRFKNSNEGSFNKVMNNLNKIYKMNPEYYQRNVQIKSVITNQSLKKDDLEFLNNPLISVCVNNSNFSMINKTPHFNQIKDKEYFGRINLLGRMLLKKKGASNLDELLNGLNYKLKYLFFRTFYGFFDIRIANHFIPNNEPVKFLGDCITGTEACINGDGTISICYNANNLIIGNVIDDCWDFNKIVELNLIKNQTANCEYCFLQRFCHLCFENVNEKNGDINELVERYCRFSRKYYRLLFSTMLKCMENNPDLWEWSEKHFKDEIKRISNNVNMSQKGSKWKSTMKIAKI